MLVEAPKIRRGEYTEVRYQQWESGRVLLLARAAAGIATWPVVWPLARLCRCSDMIFRTVSEVLSLLPYLIGVIVRAEFYRFALTKCGRNVVIECGTVFIYRDISIGDHVGIGRYCVIHHCDFGDYAMAGEGSSFLSGARQHRFDRTDLPMVFQRGQKKRIALGEDSWVGARSVVMEDVGRGSIVGAGSVVTKPVDEFTIVAGNPARAIRPRRAVKPRPPAVLKSCAS